MLLQLLSEECAEVIQAVSKIRRFGLEGSYTKYLGVKTKNGREQLSSELGDLDAIIFLLLEAGDLGLNPVELDRESIKKIKTLKTYPALIGGVGTKHYNKCCVYPLYPPLK